MARPGLIATIVTTTVGALAAPASAAPLTPRSGPYAGVGESVLEIGFEAEGGAVSGFELTFANGGCGVAGEVNTVPVTPDADGRFAAAQANIAVKGRFLTRSRVRGKATYTNPMPTAQCPATTEMKYTARRFRIGAKPPGDPGANVGDPRAGRYAGAGAGIFVWFDVIGGKVQNGGGVAHFGSSPCDFGFFAPEMDNPGGDGRFEVSGTSGSTTATIRGRFVSRTLLKGKVSLFTSSNCPAGLYSFTYTGARIADLD